jgi:diguanylate cyclase (GGDEF)-like protein/PAS domain S-box-containing protein
VLKFLQGILALAALGASAVLAAPYVGHPQAPDRLSIDFSQGAAVIELKGVLSPYHAPSGSEKDGSLWYMMTAVNEAPRPVTRILVAAEPPNISLHFFPRRGRPEIRQVASSDSGISVERARAFARHAYRVTIPPATSAALAIRIANADARPSILAWTEPALVAHNRQLAIFLAAVAGLIAAALAIMAGVAIMTGHPAPRWAALTLFAIFLARLQAAGALDGGWMSAVGGPYGLSAMLAGLALAAALRLADIVVPVSDLWPQAEPWRKWGPLALVGLSLLAFVGVPGATVLMEFAVVIGAGAIAVYLIHRGRLGAQAARVMAPSAAVFALVTAMAAVIALGGLMGNPMAPAVIGGFAAAGAVLLSLAVAGGEGIAILPFSRASASPAATAEPPSETATPDVARVAESKDAAASPILQAVAASHQGVFDLSFKPATVRLSKEAASLLGLSGETSMPHETWLARVHAEDRRVYREALADYRAHPGLAFRIEFRVKSESGRYPWFELRATMLGEGGEASRCLGLMADVTTRKEAEAAIQDRTLHDPLTGLGNRVALIEELESQGPRLAGLAFALLDVDRFKSIHASLGDAGGDEMLAGIASRLKTRFESIAKVYRVGGDAFALAVDDAADRCASIGAELVDLCATPFLVAGRNVFAAVSVGVTAGRDAEDPLDLLKNAELALIQAKRQGGGCARVFARDMEALARGDAVALETDLRRGLADNQFAVYYQPIMRLADGSVAGFEALLRWRHPEKGLISPAEFIAHSEETGLIVSLGRFVLEKTAGDLADWQRFFPLDPPLFATVNVSRRQLRDDNLGACLKSVLATGHLHPGTFKLEITESVVEGGEEVKQALERLRALGAGLAIDDFGTGLSTLSQLKDLPFETVKIDKSFFARPGGTAAEKDAAVVIGSIVALAHELKRSVVAEGVEQERDAVWLREIGCEYAQGFYFSPPMPAADVLRFIANRFKLPEVRVPAQSASGASSMG